MEFTFLMFLVVGFILGAIRKWSEKTVKINEKLQTIGVIILLFLMGLSIGMNKNLIYKFSEMGLKAFIFAFLSVLFSVLLLILLSFSKRRKSE